MIKKTIGVAIPCYKGHIPHLKYLLDSIEQQTRKPDMVIVSCSSSTDEDIPYRQEEYNFRFKIYTHPNKKVVAENRNFAASQLNTDIISFIDADDIMHPQRIEIIERAFIEHNIVLFLHNYIIGNTECFTNYSKYEYVFHINKLGISSWGSTIHIDSPKYDIHNGHTSISRWLFSQIKFHEEPEFYTKEDTVFNTEIIAAYPNYTAYTLLKLSKYTASHTYGINS